MTITLPVWLDYCIAAYCVWAVVSSVLTAAWGALLWYLDSDRRARRRLRRRYGAMGVRVTMNPAKRGYRLPGDPE